MGKLFEIDVTARTTATAATVFALVRDRSTWPDWSDLGRYEHVSGTEGQVGAEARFVTRGVRSVERIVAVEPDRLLSYELVSGLPLRGYVARIEVTPDESGSVIRWRSSFRAKVPGTGRVYHALLHRFLATAVEQLARHAASR